MPENGLPDLPEELTEPGGRFARDVVELLGFVGFVSGLALHADEVRRVAGKALRDTARDAEERAQREKALDEGNSVVKELRRHNPVLLQMTLGRLTDNFLTYLSQLLALLFRTRPETLRSREAVQLDEVLAYDSMQSLIEALAERKVDRLAYLGMRELTDDLSEKLGFNLFERPDDLERAVEIIEIRNVIVHNRGAVNRRFLSRLPAYPAEEGELISLTIERVLSELEFLTTAAFDIDARAAAKFGLATFASPGRTDPEARVRHNGGTTGSAEPERDPSKDRNGE
jgi:hypothetical protein